jgi:tRNA G18 (ribose-2'-O)-methylase SpoU
MPLLPIQSLDDPRLEIYRGVISRNLTRYSGLFIAEGRFVLERLLASSCEVQSVLMSERRVASIGPAIPAEIPVYLVTHALARELLGYKFHAGVLACGVRPVAPSLGEAVSRTEGLRLTVLACDRVTNQENVGSIIRHCAAFGADAVLLGPGCADPFSRRVLRVSMGNAFHVPLVEVSDLASALGILRERFGFEIVATLADGGTRRLSDFSRGERTAIVLGSEAEGLEPALIGTADHTLTIPMNGGTDSLNVATAAAIFLYHLTCVD